MSRDRLELAEVWAAAGAMAYPFGATPVSGFSRAKSAARRQFDRGRGEAAKRLKKSLSRLVSRRMICGGLGVAKLAAIGIDRIVADKLAHKGGKLHGVAAVYQRHDFAKEQAAALEAWAAHMETGSIATGVLKRAKANRNLPGGGPSNSREPTTELACPIPCSFCLGRPRRPRVA